VRRSAGSRLLEESPIIAAANSIHLEPVGAADWLAVGDAAVAYDPLSSQGIVKALRAGIFAAYAIADRLDKADHRGLARYAHLVRREFASYRRQHAEYCGREQRWPQSRFWSRRQG
jgi:flavin-dependent dehydrogenase